MQAVNSHWLVVKAELHLFKIATDSIKDRPANIPWGRELVEERSCNGEIVSYLQIRRMSRVLSEKYHMNMKSVKK